MKLSNENLRKLAKELLSVERESIYGEAKSSDERLSSIEKLLVEEEKRTNSHDSKETRRR
jgi:hypothetical protein